MKCRGFRVRDDRRRLPGARVTASSNGRRLALRRHAGPNAKGPLALPPADSAVHSRRGRRLSRPDPRDLNPPSSFGHFVRDVTGPLLSRCAGLPRSRQKRCARSGAAASVQRMRPFSGPAASRMACGRGGVESERVPVAGNAVVVRHPIRAVRRYLTLCEASSIVSLMSAEGTRHSTGLTPGDHARSVNGGTGGRGHAPTGESNGLEDLHGNPPPNQLPNLEPTPAAPPPPPAGRTPYTYLRTR